MSTEPTALGAHKLSTTAETTVYYSENGATYFFRTLTISRISWDKETVIRKKSVHAHFDNKVHRKWCDKDNNG